ncbi:hypothetical protein BV22DRAFT_1132961 [Leucogyrophana mollusca]|uniref:Uncharacterized protein n=1 Tax=Leucogyrophana mollusca TaxID=85980 RepID=A0ACB8B5P2_9AGAM|nr:hypothetical protein BV22DRAFT_1132961 [Leucogyrophana mollusca]
MTTVPRLGDGKVANLLPDIRDHIFGYMNAGDTANYRSTSKTNSALPQEALRHRKTVTLATFVTDVTRFVELLRSSHSVVSGSLILRMLFPFNDAMWEPTDMDIYTPIENGGTFVSFLLAEKYRVAPPDLIHASYSLSNISAVTSLIKGSRKVDVISSSTASAVIPVFQFHSTAMMSYMSANILFAAYPASTTAHGSIVNGSAFQENQFTMALCQALVKYSKRGFSIIPNIRSWIAEDDVGSCVCSQQIECPQAVRNSFDAGCLRIAFDPNVNARTINNGVNKIMVTWCLGGDCCTGMRGELESFAIVA